MRERKGVAERDQIGGFLRCLNSRNSNDFERISFRKRPLPESLQEGFAHGDERLGSGEADGFRLAADIDHTCAALVVEMTEFVGHLSSSRFSLRLPLE